MEQPRGLAGRHAIEAYGAGGFRFGGMGHRGSLLALPSGLYPWDVLTLVDVTVAALHRLFEEADEIDHVLIGTGDTFALVDDSVVRACRERRIVAEPMATAAAARTYNILLGERRRVAAALVAPTALS